jgi:hypothetical protein
MSSIVSKLEDSFFSQEDQQRFLNHLNPSSFLASIKTLNSYFDDESKAIGTYLSKGSACNRTVYESDNYFFYLTISFHKQQIARFQSIIFFDS